MFLFDWFEDFFDFIRDTREGYVDMSIGDRLMKVESFIIGIVGFFVAWLHFDIGFGKSAIVALVLCILVPCLVGWVKLFAIIFSICFSLIWGFVGYFIGAIITGSTLAGILIGVIVLILSIFVHKVFAGIGYESLLSIFLRK